MDKLIENRSPQSDLFIQTFFLMSVHLNFTLLGVNLVKGTNVYKRLSHI